MDNKDYYKTLGVDKNASDEELKKAYRRLSMQYHPDRQNGKSDSEKKAAEENFKAVNEAYSVLKDKEKRASYDRFGAAGPQGGGFDFSGFDPADFFRKMRGSFNFGSSDFDGFDFGFGGGSGSSARDFTAPVRGADVGVGVEISFKDSVNGCSKDFEINLDKPCSECSGSGIKKGTTPVKCSKCGGSGKSVSTTRTPFGITQMISACPDCGGSGYKTEKCQHCSGNGSVPEKRSVNVKIPQGVSDGQKLRLAGMGRCGRNGGDRGDMYVRVSVAESELFMRKDDDVIVYVKISPATAALGGTIKVPTPYGYRDLTIKPGQECRTVRVPGAGVKTKHNTGDLYVDISIEAPVEMTDEQKELMKKLSESETDANYPAMNRTKALADEYYA